MSPQDFCYWLQGFLEMSGAKSIDKSQTKVLQDHLKLVFQKVTPNRQFTGTVSSSTVSPLQQLQQALLENPFPNIEKEPDIARC